MFKIKPQLSINGIPRQDDFLSIWIDPDIQSESHFDWNGSDSAYIILTGVDRNSIAILMDEIRSRRQELSMFYRTHYSAGSWDVMIKPSIWMESVDSALDFLKCLSPLDEEDQSEIISDIQLEFNEPWEIPYLISDEIWAELKSSYAFYD